MKSLNNKFIFTKLTKLNEKNTAPNLTVVEYLKGQKAFNYRLFCPF